VAFYTNVCGNVADRYTRAQIDSQLKSELLTALQPAFAMISEQGIRYSALPGHTTELALALRTVLTTEWMEQRGIEIVKVGVSSVKASEEDEKTIKELQRNAVYRNTAMAGATLVGAQAQAMQDAAKNAAGAGVGFMNLNMAQNAGGINAQSLFQMQQQAPAVTAQPPAPAAAAGWTCPKCGAVGNTGKFCAECGEAKPVPVAAAGWTCSKCGAVNKGKFCPECGSPKPAYTPQYKCDKCGWEPADPTKPPKFCPECGDPFDDGDII